MDVHAERAEPTSFRDRFVLLICKHQFILYMLLAVEAMLLSLATLSLLFAEMDRATKVVLYIDFAVLGVLSAATVFGIVACRRKTW